MIQTRNKLKPKYLYAYGRSKTNLVLKMVQRESILLFVSAGYILLFLLLPLLSLKVLAEAQKELLNYGNLGISVMGMLNYKSVVMLRLLGLHRLTNMVICSQEALALTISNFKWNISVVIFCLCNFNQSKICLK